MLLVFKIPRISEEFFDTIRGVNARSVLLVMGKVCKPVRLTKEKSQSRNAEKQVV